MHNSISFGSDGWRGVIADGFTFANAARVTIAVHKLLAQSARRHEILIGYDRRFLADVIAHNAARLWESLGGRALVSASALPSPLLAWQTRELGASLGVMLTASHNPPQYLGIKLKESYGGSAPSETQAEVSRIASGIDPPAFDFDPRYIHAARFDPLEKYIDRLVDAFPRFRPHVASHSAHRVVADFMHGAGAEIAPIAFAKLGIDADYLRSERDPTFGGIGPEPVPERLTTLSQAVAGIGGNVLGIAFDGDGDRLMAMDEAGKCLGNHELYTIFLEHLVKNRGVRGRAVGSFSFSAMVDVAARNLGVALTRVPVGYKAVAAEFLKGDVIIGGEESGGTGFGFWLPERDALAMALMLYEAVIAAGKPLSEMRRDLVKSYGNFNFQSKNIRLSRRLEYSELDEALGKREIGFAGKRIGRVDAMDGRKLHLEDGCWILIRQSGTEPLVRIYAESGQSDVTKQLIEDVEAFVRNLAESSEIT